MRFEWDIYKAVANVFKHGIGFKQGLRIFDDPDRLILEKRTYGKPEIRYKLIGEIDLLGKSHFPRIVIVVYSTKLDGTEPRIISVRAASRRERRLYAQNKIMGG